MTDLDSRSFENPTSTPRIDGFDNPPKNNLGFNLDERLKADWANFYVFAQDTAYDFFNTFRIWC